MHDPKVITETGDYVWIPRIPQAALLNIIIIRVILFKICRIRDYLSSKIFNSMVYLTRVEHFNAAHKLYNPAWSREKNDAIFGKCANDNWHGHNYELYVTVKGIPNKETGFVFDAKQLSILIKEQVLEQLDHKNLNIDVPFLQGQFCTTENLAMGIWKQLSPHLPAEVQLHCIKLYETPRIYVEYFGE